MAVTDRPTVSLQLSPPAVVGTSESDIDTPALLIDLDNVEANLAHANSLLSKTPSVSVRPHFKAHKTLALAKLQMDSHTAAGVAVSGMCAQKPSEAVVLLEGGVKDVLLSNQVVGDAKLDRLAAVAAAHPDAAFSIAVDDASNVEAVGRAAVKAGVTIGVVVEVEVGQGRCGAPTPAAAVELGKVVAGCDGLKLNGIQCYNGAAQHYRTPEERQAAVDIVVKIATETKALFEEAGLPCDVVTGGGSGTFPLEAASGVFTEVQPGSYLFNDLDYSRNLLDDGKTEAGREWPHALFILSTIMSRTESARRLVFDAGLKACSLDSGPPEPAVPGLKTDYLADEHTVVTAEDDGSDLPGLGSKHRLIVPHVDPTFNCHNFVVGVRRGVVESVWLVDGRNPGY